MSRSCAKLSVFSSINLTTILISNNSIAVKEFLDNTWKEHQYSIPTLDVLILTLHGEASTPEIWKHQLQQFINIIKFHNPKLKLIVLFNSWYKIFDLDFEHVDETIYIDFFVIKTHYDVVVKDRKQFVASWDPAQTNILMMNGAKIDKLHRIRLLYKLLKTDVKAFLNWSLIYHNQYQIQSCANLIQELTLEEIKGFLETNQRDLDGLYFSGNNLRRLMFDPGIFQNSLFQLVIETDFDRVWPTAWITEKTWTAMANKRPFIIAGSVDTLDKLQSRGFRTFQNYLSIPNYDSPSSADFLKYKDNSIFLTTKAQQSWCDFYQAIKGDSWPDSLDYRDINQLPSTQQQEILDNFKLPIESVDELRLDAIVKNTVDLHKNIHNFTKEIELDVEHNYNCFVDLVEQNLSIIKNVMSRYNLDGEITDFMFITEL